MVLRRLSYRRHERRKNILQRMLTLSFCEEKEKDSKDEKQDASEVCRNVDRFLSINLFT
jgi:hypothetical protein